MLHEAVAALKKLQGYDSDVKTYHPSVVVGHMLLAIGNKLDCVSCDGCVDVDLHVGNTDVSEAFNY